MQVRPGTHRAIQDNAEQCRAIQGNAEESRTIQEIAGTHSEKQNNPRDCSAAQIHPGDFQEDTWSVAAARHSFGRHQNCIVLASGLRPELDRGACSTPSAYSHGAEGGRLAVGARRSGLRGTCGQRLGNTHQQLTPPADRQPLAQDDEQRATSARVTGLGSRSYWTTGSAVPPSPPAPPSPPSPSAPPMPPEPPVPPAPSSHSPGSSCLTV